MTLQDVLNINEVYTINNKGYFNNALSYIIFKVMNDQELQQLSNNTQKIIDLRDILRRGDAPEIIFKNVVKFIPIGNMLVYAPKHIPSEYNLFTTDV